MQLVSRIINNITNMKKLNNLIISLFWPCLLSAQTITIEESAFEGCQALRTIDIPFNCYIQTNSFSGCSSLESFQAKEIDDCENSAFSYCSSLHTIGYGSTYRQAQGTNYYIQGTKLIAACKSTIIPDFVTELSDYVYAGHSGLAFQSLPQSINKIGKFAFKDCVGLRHFTVHWDLPLNIEESVFDGVDLSNCTLYCPEGMEDFFSIAAVWKDFGSIKGGEAIIQDVNCDEEIKKILIRSINIGLHPGLYRLNGINIVVK